MLEIRKDKNNMAKKKTAEKALNILKFVGKSVILLVYKSIVHGLKKQEDFTKTKMLGGNDNV